MQVKNNILYNNDGTQVEFRPTENLSPGKKDIRFIVLHYDGASNETSAVNWLTQKGSGVSCDLHIAKSGKVVQMAEFNRKTFLDLDSNGEEIHFNLLGGERVGQEFINVIGN